MPMIPKSSPTQRAPDWWESPRFQAVSFAQGWFRQSGVVSSRPPAGNASRWADRRLQVTENNGDEEHDTVSQNHVVEYQW
jgi:hypothetical protein